MPEDKPVVDAFGQERDAQTGVPVAPPIEEVKEEGKVDKKADDGKPEDIENHPVVKGLKEALEKVKTDMGGNLSGQREIIDRLEKELKEQRAGKEQDGAFVFDPKTIKRVKDLSADEQAELTDTEKRQMDEIADMKESMNKLAQTQVKEKQDGKTQEDEVKKTQDRVGHVATTIQANAKKLAGDDVALANQIIESFNGMKFNTDGLSDEELAKRVEVAHKALPNYQAPKEQKGHRGGAPAADAKNDPFGVDSIVEEVASGKKGGYTL